MIEWCPIESDPIIFTDIIKNIGVKGVQIKQMNNFKSFDIGNIPVYGIIFQYKYLPYSGYIPNVLKVWDDDLYFFNQVDINACGTQAIISILMNNEDKIEIGDDLSDLKNLTAQMDPYMKGIFNSNCEKIKSEHNKYSLKNKQENEQNTHEKDEIYHHVAYIHFKSSIYELDGLKDGPVLIAENVQFNEWMIKVKPFIYSRISLFSNNEIKYNVMTLIPDQLEKAQEYHGDLLLRKSFITSILSGNEVIEHKFSSDYKKLSKEDLLTSLNDCEGRIAENQKIINEEEDKLKKSCIKNQIAKHNYIPFVFELLKIMNEKGQI